jgi:hypothetical protein
VSTERTFVERVTRHVRLDLPTAAVAAPVARVDAVPAIAPPRAPTAGLSALASEPGWNAAMVVRVAQPVPPAAPPASSARLEPAPAAGAWPATPPAPATALGDVERMASEVLHVIERRAIAQRERRGLI